MPWLAWKWRYFTVISALPCLSLLVAITASIATVLCFFRGMALRSVISDLELSCGSWVLYILFDIINQENVNFLDLSYSKQPIFGLTQGGLELSFSRLECGVHDRLHIHPLCGIFYFSWHGHQIEGANAFLCHL